MKQQLFHLQTKRLNFAYWQLDNYVLALKLWGNVEVTKYISSNGFNDEQIMARLKQELFNQDTFNVQYWPLFSASDEFIGACGLRPRDEATFEIGIHLLPQFWGQGFALEALRAVIDYAKIRHIKKLFAGHNPHNTASQKMLTKLGFKLIGEELYPATGLYHLSYELEL
jgi:RimJ/RimL family protein N-acetyltransferase